MTKYEGSISLVELNHMMKFGLRVVTVRNNIAGNHATFIVQNSVNIEGKTHKWMSFVNY